MVIGGSGIVPVAALAFGVAVAACSSDGSDEFPGAGGTNPAGMGGSLDGGVGAGGAPSAGGASASGVTTSAAGVTTTGGASGFGGAQTTSGATSTTGSPASVSAGGVAGMSSSSGGAAATGQGGVGAGGATSGGTAGVAGTSGSGGNGGAGGSGGSGGEMRSAGCGNSPTLTSGSHTIQSGGQNRSYILSIPDNYDNNQPYRLVFAYHWRGGTMQDIDGGGSSGDAWSYYGLRAQAENSTIFVAPQGIGNGWPNTGGQDLDFTDAMLELIQGDLCVDRNRIFALGFSYGGGMSYALACGRPQVFRAVAVYAGGVLSGCDGGTEPVAYLGIHGISDGTLNISGGRSMRDRFVTNNGCTPQNPPEAGAGSGTHVCTSYEGCEPGYPVRWCSFDGGHTPGHVDGGGDDGARTWTKEEVWQFFSQFQ